MKANTSKVGVFARKRAVSIGGRLFTVSMIGLFAFLGIYKLTTGHLPEYWQYAMWAMIALSIVADVYFGILEAIEKSKDEIKEAIDRAQEELRKEMEKLK